jgi:hypothetical protein
MSSLAISPYTLSSRVRNSGASEAAARLEIQYTEALNSTHLSQAMRHSVFGLLDEIFEECMASGWDGYSAVAISSFVYANARNFLSSLPVSVPLPNDIVAEADGEIAFEWRNGPRQVFSVSVGRSDVLSFAGLFGLKAKTHGTEIFEDAIPQTVISNIRRVCGTHS